MVRQSNPNTEQRWKKLLAELQQSGLTVAEFCRQENVSAASIYQWKRRLGMGSLRANRRAVPARTAKPSTTLAPFVEIAVPRSRRIEMELASGVKIYIPADQLDALTAAIRACQDVQTEVPSC